MSTLSLSMIVKNEEKYLADCLKSVQGIANQIVVVDTGSTDNTIEIAKKYGAEIFHFDWINDFSAARNFALSKTTGDWVLYLDADERLTADSIDELKRIIISKENLGYFCKVISQDKHNAKPNIIRYTRLFKNSSDIAFEGSIHEQIVFSLKRAKYKILESDIKIDHLGYDIPADQMKEKAERNLLLLLDEYNNKKTDYVIFQIAQTYGVLNQPGNAIKYFDEILDRPGSPALFKSHSWRYKAAIESHYNQEARAYEYAKNAEAEDDSDPVLLSLLTRLYLKRGEFETSCGYAKRAIKENRTKTDKEFKLNIVEHKVLILGLEASVSGELNKQYDYFISEFRKDKIVKNPNKIISLLESIRNGELLNDKLFIPLKDSIYLNLLKRITELNQNNNFKLHYLSSLADKFQDETELKYLLGMVFMNTGMTAKATLLFEECLDKKYNQPSIIFFLVSMYLNAGEIDKIKQVVLKAEKIFSGNADISSRITILKQKLNL